MSLTNFKGFYGGMDNAPRELVQDISFRNLLI